MRKLIITLDILEDTDIEIIKYEFEHDILPDYEDVVKSTSVRIESEVKENGKKK